MLKKVDSKEFEKLRPLSLSLEMDFIRSTAQTDKLNPVFYIFYKNEEATIWFALYEKGKKIVLPSQLVFYSGIGFKENLPPNELLDDFVSAISEVKKRYKTLEIVTHPSIKDLRPFLWNGFQSHLRYTYLKATENNNLKRNLLRNYNMAKNKYSLFTEVCTLYKLDWECNRTFLASIGLRDKKIEKVRRWLELLEKGGFLLCMKATKPGFGSLGSAIVFLDKIQKNGLFFLVDVPKSEIKSEVNALIHIDVKNWLQDNGYHTLDFLGANMPSVANFKSRFNPELMPYFLMKYQKSWLDGIFGLYQYTKRFVIRNWLA